MSDLKTSSYYKGCRDPRLEISKVSKDWRLVECTGGFFDDRFYGVRYSDGSFSWEKGNSPVSCGVYCDNDWNPIYFVTEGGRKLPVLDENN